MKRAILTIGGRLAMLVAVTLLGGLLSATLVRLAPGFGIDERELDPRLSQASLEAFRASRRLESGLLGYYRDYLVRALHGDFGKSQWLDQPVGSLIRERLPVTARAVLYGMSLAWTAALITAIAALFFRGFVLDLVATAGSGLLIALPTGIVAMLAVYLRAPAFLAISVVIFPKLFRYLRNLLEHAYAQPHVLAARARGIGTPRIVTRHVLPFVSPALFALFGVSLGMAFGAAIPIEALSDSPGIGQLAWQAALNRDLPLIVNLTLLVTLFTVAVNSAASVPATRAQ